MTDNRDQSKETKELTSSLEDVLASKDHLSSELQSELEEILALESEVSFPEEDGASSNFQFEVSLDKMELWLHLFALKEGQSPALIDDIMETFVENSYQCELLIEDIQKALTSDLSEHRKVLAGRGSPPVEGTDGHIEFHVEEPNENLLVEDDHERVDYRTHYKIVDVRKDQELLTVNPPVESVPGKDVHGNLINAKEGTPVQVKAGRNIQYIRETGVMYATVDGCFLKSKNTFKVEDVFIVQGDLDMSIGNIDTLSKVMIQGNVHPGFMVRSGSDIHVTGNVEGSSLISENGWIQIEGGILGKNQSRIKAPKGLFCKFAQQALISSEGVIHVDDSILFCTISCGERLEVSGGKHSVISGGNIRIHKSIDALTIGASSEPLTSITLGFDFAYEDELSRLDMQKLELMSKIEELGNQAKLCEREIAKLPRESIPAKETKKEFIHFKKEILLLKVEIEEVTKKISFVESRAFAFGTAWIRAKKSIHGNTVIKMNRRAYRIENEEKDVLLEIDSKNEELTLNGEKV
jgi:uncharacterized protein